MDGTGVPVVPKETVGREGKAHGQPAHTREVKLGCVFLQTTWDQEGYPIRDTDSTTYSEATRCVPAISMAGSEDYWEGAGWPDSHFYVAHTRGMTWGVVPRSDIQPLDLREDEPDFLFAFLAPFHAALAGAAALAI